MKRNLTYSCFFFQSFPEQSLSLELLSAACLLKTSCFEKRTACVIKTDEKITKRSEPTNHAQTKINIVKGLQTYLNDLKNYPTTYQEFKIRLEIIKILGKY